MLILVELLAKYIITRTLLQRPSVSLAWRLDQEMRRWFKFLRNRIYSLKVFYFLLYRRQYFLFLSEFIKYTCLQQPEIHLLQAICMFIYTKIQGPWFQRNYIIARDQKSDLHRKSFRSLPKINHMLITRTICIQWKLTTSDHRSLAN